MQEAREVLDLFKKEEIKSLKARISELKRKTRNYACGLKKEMKKQRKPFQQSRMLTGN